MSLFLACPDPISRIPIIPSSPMSASAETFVKGNPMRAAMKRRDFVRASAILAGGSALNADPAFAADLPALQPIKVAPKITDAERLQRIEKARRLMKDNGIDAIVLEGGTSMFYFTGVRWG